MWAAAGARCTPSGLSQGFGKLNLNRSSHTQPSPIVQLHVSIHAGAGASLAYQYQKRPVLVFYGGSGSGSAGGGGGDGGGEGGDESEGKRKKEAILALAVEEEVRKGERLLDGIPKDLAAAIESGRIPASIASRYFELEKSPLLRWLLQFGGFKERLLADDLFLAKLLMECGVGIFTKLAAEYERRGENFFKELEIVFADLVMGVIADYMLVYLPAPTVALRSPVAVKTGPIIKFFYNCPDNAFQVAFAGTSYSLLQRIGAIVHNGAKLFVVGTTSSLVGMVLTNAMINAKKAVEKSTADEGEHMPVLGTTVAYGVYMAVSSNLRHKSLNGFLETCPDYIECYKELACSLSHPASFAFMHTNLTQKSEGLEGSYKLLEVRQNWQAVTSCQLNQSCLSTELNSLLRMSLLFFNRYQVVAGVIEQRILEPWLRQHKLILSALCFAVRTGNTFLGSLMWVDYARWVGVQKAKEVE